MVNMSSVGPLCLRSVGSRCLCVAWGLCAPQRGHATYIRLKLLENFNTVMSGKGIV